jgi:hypothetical protein
MAGAEMRRARSGAALRTRLAEPVARVGGIKIPRWVVWLGVFITSVVLFCIVVLAALGKGILAGLAIEWVLCLVVISLVGMVIGTIAGGGYVEVKHPNWTRFSWAQKVYIFGSGAVLFAGSVVVFWWLFSSDVGGFWRWAILIGSLAGIVLGALLALFPVPPLPAALARGPLTALGPRPPGAKPRRSLWSQSRADLADAEPWEPSTPLWLLLGAAIGVVVAVGYVGVSAWHENSYVPSFGVTPPVPADISGGYLALGDSYSAGEGLSPFEPPTDTNGCHRSAAGHQSGYPDTTNAAYGVLLQHLLGARVTSFDFVACSSAIVHDVLNERSDGTVKPQVDLASKVKSPVGLVTLTIGGNDAIFTTVVRQCLTYAGCFTADFPPGGKSAEQTDGKDVPVGPLTEWAPKTIAKIGEEDYTLFSALRQYFGPKTRIIVLGYPHLFPDGRTIGFPWSPVLCASELSRFGEAQQRDLWQLQIELTDRTYEEAAAAGVEFVSPDAIWGQHMPCGTDTPYTHSVKPYLGIPPIDSGAFHPNAAGQHAYFDLLACYLDAYPTAPPAFLPGAPVLTSIPVDTSLGDKGLTELHLEPVPGEAQVPGHGRINGCQQS